MQLVPLHFGSGGGGGGSLKCAPCPQIGSTQLALGGPGSFFEDKVGRLYKL
jgi:hypothetical protein